INLLLFTLRFLQIKEYAPRLFKWLNLLISILVVYVISVLVFGQQDFRKLIPSLTILSIISSILAGIISLLKDYKPAGFFVLAWLTLLLSIILITLQRLGVLPINFITEYSLYIGMILQAVLFSIALAKRIEVLKKEKEEAFFRLSTLDKMKDEFLSNTSHELRTPLNGIIGIAESLVDGIAGELNESAKNNLFIIIHSGKRLSSLVNDILDFNKLKNNEIQLQWKTIRIKDIVDIVFLLSRPLIGSKSIQLLNCIPENIYVRADENRLQQILHNLTGNAIKFTEEGKIEALYLPQDSDKKFYQFAIVDTGIGIPEDKFDAIFLSFEQGDASIERRYGGTGIGLSISRQLLELHGGKIHVESKLKEGSKFIFSLIAAKPEDGSETEKYIENVEYRELSITDILRKKDIVKIEGNVAKILIVDDEIVNLQVIENQLSLHGFIVYKSSSGEEALRMIPEIQPDLILLDIMMPRLSGYEVCRKLRQIYKPNELPIIFLSAKSQMEAIIHGFEQGGNDYMIKPFNKDELRQRVTTHIHLTKVFKMTNQFFPEEYLKFLSLSSVLDIQLGKYIKKDMSIMFIDIRSYTSISEKMNIEENFTFINQFLEYITPAIRNNEGLVNQYLGDGLMIIFPGAVETGVHSAISVLEGIRLFNKKLEEEGKEAIRVGIGINYGEVAFGIIGSKYRKSGNVISDTVNLAARMEGLTKFYDCTVIISEYIYTKILNKSLYPIRYLDKVRAKGKTKPVKIYELITGGDPAMEQQKLDTMRDYDKGIQFYLEGEYDEALKVFKELNTSPKKDRLIEIYQERIAEIIQKGIPKDWDGSFEHHTK
ncbi:MAG: response regulator, partial [Leptospiraceae bacterium]|nr:response regulator [Leptospiraceae bacterium]